MGGIIVGGRGGGEGERRGRWGKYQVQTFILLRQDASIPDAPTVTLGACPPCTSHCAAPLNSRSGVVQLAKNCPKSAVGSCFISPIFVSENETSIA